MNEKLTIMNPEKGGNCFLLFGKIFEKLVLKNVYTYGIFFLIWIYFWENDQLSV